MFFLFGEKIRSKSTAVGVKHCPVCHAEHPFTEQQESLWFCLFAIPLLPIERTASYWRCDNCLMAYKPGALEQPSSVPVAQRITLYLLLGYAQRAHAKLAGEICLKLTGFELDSTTRAMLVREINTGGIDMVEYVRSEAASTNAIGKQQIIEAAFLATYACCDLQYEDRLRINLIGNALGVGLEFVDYAIAHSRKQNYYGIRRLGLTEPEV